MKGSEPQIPSPPSSRYTCNFGYVSYGVMKLCRLLLQISIASMASSECGPEELVAEQQVLVTQNTICMHSNPGRGSKVHYRYMSDSQECKDHTVFTEYSVQ